MLLVVGYATATWVDRHEFAHAIAEPTMSILTPVAQTSLAGRTAVELQRLGAPGDSGVWRSMG